MVTLAVGVVAGFRERTILRPTQSKHSFSPGFSGKSDLPSTFARAESQIETASLRTCPKIDIC
jgi:hypothetical protein